jgi:Tfp pilus assembly protein PilN
MKPVRLNLASHPLRNRRLFLYAGAGLALASLVAVLLGLFIFSRFALKIRVVRAELARLEQSVQTAEREKARSTARTQEAMKGEQSIVDFVNSIIFQKSFSWAEFLSRIEEGLPDSSYILSLAPVAVESNRVQVRLKVASPTLDDQLALINKLLELSFSQIRVEGEEIDNQGLLISDILATYERRI